MLSETCAVTAVCANSRSGLITDTAIPVVGDADAPGGLGGDVLVGSSGVGGSAPGVDVQSNAAKSRANQSASEIK